jgi:hypothetical protein
MAGRGQRYGGGEQTGIELVSFCSLNKLEYSNRATKEAERVLIDADSLN